MDCSCQNKNGTSRCGNIASLRHIDTENHENDQLEKMVWYIDTTWYSVKEKYNLIGMGDFNSLVDKGLEHAMGSFGLGTKTQEGLDWYNFLSQNLVITNTLFKQHKRGLYPWKIPGDTGRYLIYCILSDQNTVIKWHYVKYYQIPI